MSARRLSQLGKDTPSDQQTASPKQKADKGKSGSDINWWGFIGPIATVVGVIAIIIGIPMLIREMAYRSHVQQEAEKVAMRQAEAVRLEAEAVRLRPAITLPERDTTFIVTATTSDSEIYKVRESYCLRTEPVNLAQSYIFTTQRGRFVVTPEKEVEFVGRVAYFSVKAFGGPTTEVQVWYWPKSPDGECRPPRRDIGVVFFYLRRQAYPYFDFWLPSDVAWRRDSESAQNQADDTVNAKHDEHPNQTVDNLPLP